MVKTLLIYKSKYKATKESVKKLAKILGPARCIECNEFDKDCEKYDFYVMVSPIYYEEIDKELKDFLVKKKDFFKNKKVAALSFSMSDGFYDRYLKIYKDILGDSLVYYNNFGSVINVEKLDKTDYESLEKFYEKMSMPLKDKDTRDDLKLALSGLEIKRIKDDLELKCKRKDILYEVEDYLRRHNTCTLCTASSIGVRGTPIEYNYFNKSLYFISEGGEKFANILLNKNVSVTLYDNYV
ncbi:MAG: flavodoxin domain-containing protein, partial [Clostridiaceae bacterium]